MIKSPGCYNPNSLTMPDSPEARARETIDRLLTEAGWIVQSRDAANVTAGRGVAIREFPLKAGYGFADYLLYVDGVPAGVIEAKKGGETLTGYEIQTEKYSVGLPDELKPYRKPLPFCYQSTGIETRFTNLLEPDARSRPVFAFHRPETFAEWLIEEAKAPGSTLRARLKRLPPLIEQGLWPAQVKAIRGLERSLAEGRPRALIQMASGGGKTFTACNFCYRLIKHAGAKRILFLVDRKTLGRQAKTEFEQFTTPEEHRKFTELYNVQLLQSNKLDPVGKVCVTTIQRLYAMLKGEEEMDAELEEAPLSRLASLLKEPVPVNYNPAIPIEFFDFIVVDECHRSIYNLWRQVLEYFDAFLVGLTATPSKQTFGFFNQNLVMEYNHEQAVADGVNVGFDVYRIRTYISEHGSRVESGLWVDKRDRLTRRIRWEQLDEDFAYASNQLDRDVVAPDQIRTIIRTFKEKLFTEIFPGRTEVPKTLIFAKDDSHAEDIVNIVREEFGKGNDFCQKITYRTGTIRVPIKKKLPDGTEVDDVVYKSIGSATAEDLLVSFRNSYFPRVAVTVDMIATGTDVRPLECVMFLREVKSRTLFEQMKGRGARVVTETELKAVTPDADAKTHFVIVDAVGVCEGELVDTHPLEKKPSVAFEKLLEAVAFGNREKDVLSSLASRLARLDRQLNEEERKIIHDVAGGKPLSAIAHIIVDALDPDNHLEAAKRATGMEEPPPEAVEKSAAALLAEAAKPIATNPALRNKLVELKKSFEQTIDAASKDQLLEAGPSPAAKDRSRNIVESFEKFIREHKDEITALQILYSRPYKQRLTLKAIKELAAAIEKPPRGWTPELLWHAYQLLEKSKVRGSGGKVLADIVSLVRLAFQQENELRPFRDEVNERFAHWLAEQESNGRRFTDEQRQWLEAIRDHIAASLAIEPDDFDYVPFIHPVATNQGFKSFVLWPELLSDYVYYYLKRARELAIALSSGTTFREVSGANAALIPVPIAPPPEQARIVAEIEKQFTRLEAGIAALKRVHANLKRYRAAVLKAAVEGRLVPTEAELARCEGRSYEPATELLKRILAERRARWEADQIAKFRASGKEPKDEKWKAKYEEPGTPNAEKLSPPREGWAWAQLDQLLIYLRNGIPRKPDLEVGIPILRISAVRPLRVDMNDVRFLSGNLEDYAGYVLQEGDLLFTRYNGNPVLTGVCGVVRTVHRPTVHPDKLIRAKVAKGMCSSAFLEIAVNVGASRDFIARRVRTTAGQAGISGGDLRSIPVPLAPGAEQQRIVAEVERRLSVTEELEMQIEANLKRAQRLRQAILKRAFEGRLVPQDPDDEPASALLERIAERDANKQRASGKKKSGAGRVLAPKG